VTTPVNALTAGLTTPLGNDAVEDLRHKPLPEVAREFEAMLVAQMIGAMRKSVGDSGLLSASPERRMLDGFFDLELARSVLKGTDLGLARQLTTQLEARVPAAAFEAAEPISEPLLGPLRGPLRGPLLGPLRGPLLGPVTAEVSSPYGERLDPITGEPAFHAGVDLAAPAGTPVQAAAAGEVVFSGRRGSAGNLVEIRHPDGAKTSYAHLHEIHVDVGETLGAGEVLGSVGTTGRTTGPHLHFSVEHDGRAVDPETLWRGPSGWRKPLGAEKIS